MNIDETGQTDSVKIIKVGAFKQACIPNAQPQNKYHLVNIL